MLYIFTSSSAADVVMQRFSAEKIFSVIGKTLTKTGVISLDEIDAAVEKIESELERQALIERGLANSGTEISIQHDAIQFRKTATFFLDLLRNSKAAGTHVTWGI
jgi:Domain of unknown function (DUF1840)